MTMNRFHRLISKKLWFFLFNLAAVIYLMVTGSLRWNLISIFSYGVALLLMNGIAWISARKYKDWK
jgi:hypothetical protein